MVGMAGIQLTLGFAGIRGPHVFSGVLFLCVATVFCSYTWRHKPAVPATTTSAEAPTH